MEANIKLGRISGIELGLHFSWFFIALLITVSLAAHFRFVNKDWGDTVVWATALLTGALFFAGLILHEMSHALMARARGLPIRKITLFALGGVAQIEKEASDPATEFLVGIVGPATSVVLGAALLGLAWLTGWMPNATPSVPGVALLVWLGYINIALGVFNMIPGFPLDGGRILRAILWWVTGSGDRATRIAARTGQLVASLFIFIGIFRFFTRADLSGLWLVLIGWFLYQAASSSYLQLEAATALRGVRVRDLMTRECLAVDPQMTVRQFVDEQLLRTGHRCFFVMDDGRLAGMVTPHEVKLIERERWPVTTIWEIRRPLDEIRWISPDAPVMEAVEMMATGDVNQLPVVAGAQIVGTITRSQIVQLLQSRSEVVA